MPRTQIDNTTISKNISENVAIAFTLSQEQMDTMEENAKVYTINFDHCLWHF